MAFGSLFAAVRRHGLVAQQKAAMPLFGLCSQIRAHSSSQIAVRNNLSNIWVPTGGITEASGDTSGHIQLLKAGFLRQSTLGMFHMLPLGLRVQKKIEALLDVYMQSVGGTRLGMSTISSKDLWVKSGRYQAMAAEAFQLQDRKESAYLLGPTHEEEMTNLVAKTVKSYKDLPLRLYQITNKYRDELRPRNGLLRGREFIMKDMYSFDIDTVSALKTYEEVRSAYAQFFSNLKLPFLVAEASTGDMGGSLSHEFHIESSLGEDTVISCSSCDYLVNDELAEARLPQSKEKTASQIDRNAIRVWRGITKDRKTLVNAWYASSDSDATPRVNQHAIKSLIPDLDPSIEDAVPFWSKALEKTGDDGQTSSAIRVVNLVDFRLGDSFISQLDHQMALPESLRSTKTVFTSEIITSPANSPATAPLNLLRVQSGDNCPRCTSGHLQLFNTLELGHTFHLGTRYSEPLGATVNLPAVVSPSGKDEFKVPIQMGCFGIGVTRIIGAIAETMADSRGLRWPAAIAPFQVAIVADKALVDEGAKIYDNLAATSYCDFLGRNAFLDVVLDNRNAGIPWKLKDADLAGYPILVVVGKAFRELGQCEVQCRALDIKETKSVGELSAYICELLQKL
ncbi:Proline--tRNA ligase [Ceratocystis fimbriata CBS 114723]|uniref:proline--tRNA ligase n=1 Tax=Ceratocystis fimbriata CBS 114723 TaxID=1035309 RepID=A0A2C5X609_9PEZI|nr:Proline--tRNA ligase [Ceratocystis fimbriata CBS 114723]